MPKARGTAIHGTRRVVLRQRRFRGIFLHPRTRGAVPAPLRHEGKGPRGHHRLVLRLLQHPTSAQLGRVATTRRLREDRDHPTGGRIKEASTFSGEAHTPLPSTAKRDDLTRPVHRHRRTTWPESLLRQVPFHPARLLSMYTDSRLDRHYPQRAVTMGPCRGRPLT